MTAQEVQEAPIDHRARLMALAKDGAWQQAADVAPDAADFEQPPPSSPSHAAHASHPTRTPPRKSAIPPRVTSERIPPYPYCAL
jgi:hypothetical protein